VVKKTKMIDGFIALLNAIVSAIERLLGIVNSGRKLLFLTCIVSMVASIYLMWQVASSQELIAQLVAPRIVRARGWCYEQQVRYDRRIVAIQFPVNPELIKLGVSQNLAAVVFQRRVTDAEFDSLCNGLINEIYGYPGKLNLLRSNPAIGKVLEKYNSTLDHPIASPAPFDKLQNPKPK
jgi:hypothetical protein